MDVCIDEAWQNCRGAQIDDFCVGRNSYARADGGNAIAFDDDDLIFEKFVALAVEELAAFDVVCE
jgi:hypothetical protein